MPEKGRRASGRGRGEPGRRLLRWYGRCARDLPWRRRPTPYRVWVSEIMLQQTTVATVGPYFTRFVKRFPDLATLAGARVEDVLALWSGLGYYRRARSLHAAARACLERHGGRIPSDLESLLALPGVGAYTAGAIRSIGFDRPAAALDGNIVRVLARLDAVRGNAQRPATRRALEVRVLDLMAGRSPSAINQALMDLGATVCTPRRPACGLCPLVRDCLAFARGCVEACPAPARRPAGVDVSLAALALIRAGGSRRDPRDRCLMVKLPRGEMRGLWDFPLADGDTRREVDRAAARLRARVVGRVGVIRHVITRHRIRITVYLARPAPGGAASRAARGSPLSGTLSLTGAPAGRPRVRSRHVRVARATGRWVALNSVATGPEPLALTATARKIARLVVDRREAG